MYDNDALKQGPYKEKISYRTAEAKGQLISKANFKLFIWTKKLTKIFLYFCPRSKKPLKVVETKDKSTKKLI